MIHTFTMYSKLDIYNVRICETELNTTYGLASDILSNTYPGITATITCAYGGWKLFLFIDVIKLLGKSCITDKDYYTVESIIDRFSMCHFGEVFDFTLTRLEYRYDVVVSESKREFFLRRYKKTVNKRGFNKKRCMKLQFIIAVKVNL